MPKTDHTNNVTLLYCKQLKAGPVQPQMAHTTDINLHSHIKPFTHTVVDYFGTLSVKKFKTTDAIKEYIRLTKQYLHVFRQGLFLWTFQGAFQLMNLF